MKGFKFGIEHEVAFLRPDGNFADYTNTTYQEFTTIINELPLFKEDKDMLRVDRFKIMAKRWYAEGYERFGEDGSLKHYLVKAIEVRTPPFETIDETLKTLGKDFALLKQAALKQGFTPTWISYHPYLTQFHPDPPLNDYEIHKLQISPEDRTYDLVMLSYGPDLNISMDGLTDEQVVDIGKKLTYYSPFIVPFTYSSPFYKGKLWSGLSVRTYIRTGGGRQAARVFLQDGSKLIPDSPLTREARLPVEAGRIEFKAVESCNNPNIYAGILALLKGLILDRSLTGRSLDPDTKMHKISAKSGFDDPLIFQQACDIIKAVEQALENDPDKKYLIVLKEMLKSKETPAKKLIGLYHQTKSIDKVLKQSNYDQLI